MFFGRSAKLVTEIWCLTKRLLPTSTTHKAAQLQPALLLQPELYLGDMPLAGLKRGRTRVHGVVSEREFVRMARRRSEHEFGIGLGMKINRLV